MSGYTYGIYIIYICNIIHIIVIACNIYVYRYMYIFYTYRNKNTEYIHTNIHSSGAPKLLELVRIT
jgi:hypothetical protein